ncbi:MAG: nadK [Burkholderiaceae bacterium]|nr:nadK [Burkholderiaceae bacterium]
MQVKRLTFALVGRRYTSSVMQSLAKIADFLQGTGHHVAYESETAENAAPLSLPVMPLDEIGKTADAAIVVGGDGTMLGIARQLAPYGVPLIGINHGRLGFMADIPLDRMIPVLSDILEGKFQSEKRSLLEGTIYRDDEKIHQAIAFNDIVVSRGAGAGMIELCVTVDGHFMYSQRSDGLVIATPTGSTAYALSVGGPLLHPNLDGIVLAAIAPHALSNRPIVVPDKSEIMVEIVEARFPTINFDSQSFASVSDGDRIVIRRSKYSATFLHPRGWSYYDTLRDKLHWNQGRSARQPIDWGY